jgi:DNA mismatch endonuclease (patch repair protein)
VDGCFWHACPAHGALPHGNGDYWALKFRATRRRDRDTTARLESAGWRVLRIWEHVPLATATDLVMASLDRAGSNASAAGARSQAFTVTTSVSAKR